MPTTPLLALILRNFAAVPLPCTAGEGRRGERGECGVRVKLRAFKMDSGWTASWYRCRARETGRINRKKLVHEADREGGGGTAARGWLRRRANPRISFYSLFVIHSESRGVGRVGNRSQTAHLQAAAIKWIYRCHKMAAPCPLSASARTSFCRY